MNTRKGLRYAMHGAKLVAACLSLYFMFTKQDEAEHVGSHATDADMDELDRLEREEISIQN